MEPTEKATRRFWQRIKAKLTKLGFRDNTLKLSLLLSLILFGAALLLFKFEILSYLSSDETTRLNTVTSLKALANNPIDPIQGFMQWLSLKALPNHHIFALRLPSAYLLGATIVLTSISLYLKFRNRYLPYTFALLAISSPWIILLSHQGYIPGIDILALSASIIAAYFIVTKSDLKEKWKRLAMMKAAAAIGLLTLQPFGFVGFILVIFLSLRSKEIRQFISNLNKKQKAIIFSPLFILPLIAGALIYVNTNNWKLLSGLNLIENPSGIFYSLIYNVRSILGIEQTQGLSLGTGRLNFLLIGALSLTVYEIFKKRVGRLNLIIGLCISVLISAIFRAPTSIAMITPFTIAILSLALANMIRIIDAAFPRNPYPRNIARTGMLMLICLIASLNIYTFITATARENTPSDINTVTINRQKVVN